MSRPYVRSPYRQGSRGWLNEGLFTLNNFGGGLNNVEPDTLIADNEMSDTQNMRFVSANLMEKRQGIKEVNANTYPQIVSGTPAVAQPITWVDKYYPLEGDPVFVTATDSELYIGGTKICNVQGRIRGVTFIGKYYFVDGTNLYVYNGTTYYRVIAEPMSYLAQDYNKMSQFIYVENIPEQTQVGDKVYILASTIPGYIGADITKTITNIDVNAKKITVDSNVGESIPKIRNGKKTPIYLYVPLDTNYLVGEEIFDDTNHRCYYKPCVNELADEYAGGSYIPANPEIIVSHSNRLFISGDDESPNAVFMSGYSALAPQPLYWPSSASVSIKPNGQSIVDMVVFDDALIIGRHEDMYVLYGNSEYPQSVVPNGTPFNIKQMDVSTGFMHADCGAMLNNFYIYLGYDGRFYKLNTPTTFVEYLMTRPLEYKLDIYNAPISKTQNSIVSTSCAAYRSEILFALDSDVVIVYNYDNMAFTYYTGWNANSLYTDGNSLYIGRNDGKFAYWCDDENVYTDLNEAISAKQYTKRYDFGASINYKYFKRYMITTQTYNELLSSIDVQVEVDYFYVYDATIVYSATVFNSNKSMFGITEWGDIFTNKDVVKNKYVNLDIKGRTIQFRFENDKTHTLEDNSVVGEPFKIYDVNLIYTSRDVR